MSAARNCLKRGPASTRTPRFPNTNTRHGVRPPCDVTQRLSPAIAACVRRSAGRPEALRNGSRDGLRYSCGDHTRDMHNQTKTHQLL